MDEKELQKLAKLARINISVDKLQKLQKDMEGILKYVSQIKKVAVEREEKIIVNGGAVLREDEHPHESGMHTAELLKGVPKSKDGYVEVKKIL